MTQLAEDMALADGSLLSLFRGHEFLAGFRQAPDDGYARNETNRRWSRKPGIFRFLSVPLSNNDSQRAHINGRQQRRTLPLVCPTSPPATTIP